MLLPVRDIWQCFKTGTFSADAQKRAWQGYKNGSKYASMAPVVDEIVSYTDQDGEEVMDKFKPTDYSRIIIFIIKKVRSSAALAKGVAGPEQTIEVQTNH